MFQSFENKAISGYRFC